MVTQSLSPLGNSMIILVVPHIEKMIQILISFARVNLVSLLQIQVFFSGRETTVFITHPLLMLDLKLELKFTY